MRRLTAVVLSVASVSVIAVCAYRIGRGRNGPAAGEARSASDVDSPASADDNARVNDAVGRIDRRLAALEFKQNFAKPAEVQAAIPVSSAAGALVDIAAEKEKAAQRAVAIDAALKAEQRDGAWASATEHQLQGAVDTALKEGAEFSVKSVKCLTTICEMVLSASSPDRLQHTGLQLMRYIQGMGSFDFGLPVTAPDGSATVTYRLFRAGYPRPDEGT
jgi:hypothetical protein